ncbi:MAG TPA: hypothetical protein VF676_01405 [Flavobacterium sp.]|jgi:hypothetical protein
MKKLILVVVLMFAFSGQAQLGGLLKKVVEKGGAKQKSAGVTSATHQKYMNKIVFASSETGIAKGAEDESLFISKFTLGDPVIFRVYTDKPLVSYVKGQFPESHAYYTIKFWLNDVLAHETHMQPQEFTADEKSTWTTWRGALKSPANDRYLCLDLFNDFLKENEDKLVKGDYKLRIELLPCNDYPRPFTGPVVASGEITMTVNKAVADPNDPLACMPKTLLSDKVLEAKILTAFKAQGWNEVPKEVRITSAKWNIVRHKVTGYIISRYVEATIGSTREGKCINQSFNFYQDYDGSGYQDEVYLKGVGPQKTMSCACLKL